MPWKRFRFAPALSFSPHLSTKCFTTVAFSTLARRRRSRKKLESSLAIHRSPQRFGQEGNNALTRDTARSAAHCPTSSSPTCFCTNRWKCCPQAEFCRWCSSTTFCITRNHSRFARGFSKIGTSARFSTLSPCAAYSKKVELTRKSLLLLLRHNQRH